MAVVAPGFVKVDLNRRPVQHLEGGIVRAVLVRDGQSVNAGDPILMLGDVGVEADRNRLAYRMNVERAGLARLEAEQAGAQRLVFPRELQAAARTDERIKHALLKESALFDSRRHSLDSEVALMSTQRERIEQETVALRAQITQVQNSLALQQKDLAHQSKPAQRRLHLSQPHRADRGGGDRLRGQAGGAALGARARRAASGRERSEDSGPSERLRPGGERSAAD